jgi:hypothetical protein
MELLAYIFIAHVLGVLLRPVYERIFPKLLGK